MVGGKDLLSTAACSRRTLMVDRGVLVTQPVVCGILPDWKALHALEEWARAQGMCVLVEIQQLGRPLRDCGAAVTS